VAEQVTEEPTIDIFASLYVEPASRVVEVATPPVINPPLIEQEVVPVEAFAPPVVENLDDIVAALNASYAVVATEPETREPVADAQQEISAPVVIEETPKPIESPVMVSSPEIEPAEQSWLEETEKDEGASEGTATGTAF
jgi:hypothetical protein